MALQMATFLKGKMDNIVFYQRQGSWIARTRPATIRQAAATKIRSRNFGIAARAAKSLRVGLLPVLPFPKERSMQIGFSGAIARWMHQESPGSLAPVTGVPFVNNFSFNKSISIADRWKIPLSFAQPTDLELEWQIPSFIPTGKISAPAHAVAVQCTVAVACCRLADGQLTSNDSTSFSIPYTNTAQPARTIALPASTTTGTLVLMALSLRYMLSSGTEDKRNVFLPSSVVYARYY